MLLFVGGKEGGEGEGGHEGCLKEIADECVRNFLGRPFHYDCDGAADYAYGVCVSSESYSAVRKDSGSIV